MRACQVWRTFSSKFINPCEVQHPDLRRRDKGFQVYCFFSSFVMLYETLWFLLPCTTSANCANFLNLPVQNTSDQTLAGRAKTVLSTEILWENKIRSCFGAVPSSAKWIKVVYRLPDVIRSVKRRNEGRIHKAAETKVVVVMCTASQRNKTEGSYANKMLQQRS